MKITIDNIINFMKNKQNLIITDKQVKEIKKHFYKDVEKLVYWSFTERCFDIKLEGIITKKFYDRITKDEYKNKEYSFGEVIDNMGDVDFKIEEINQSLPNFENNIPKFAHAAKNLVIHIFKDSKEHVKIELPATALLDIENLIPDDVKIVLMEKSLNLNEIKFNYLKSGLVPGELFVLETVEITDNLKEIPAKFHVYLT